MEPLNRAATAWLITRFVGAANAAGDDSFGTLVDEHFPDDAAMRHLVRLVRAAGASEPLDFVAEAAGLRAIVHGCTAANVPESSVSFVFDALLETSRRRIAGGQALESDPLLDETTGLPNHHLFLDRLSHAIGFAHRHDTLLAVCSIRLDLGGVREFVPRIALEVADRLRHTFREIDTIARLGVDEFTIIITDVPSRENADVAIGKLTEVLAEPFDIGDRAYEIAAHVGIAHYPPHGHDAHSLLEAARTAAVVSRAVNVYGESGV